MSHTLTVNGMQVSLDAPGDTPLLWVLRDELNLTGTKYGCGVAVCGACIVHIDGAAVPSCRVTLADVRGEVTTIEGLGRPAALHPVQEAWIRNQVAQCGYCQSGQIMQAAALLAENSDPSDAEIDDWMAGTVCQCGTYSRIRAAIHQAADAIRGA